MSIIIPEKFLDDTLGLMSLGGSAWTPEKLINLEHWLRYNVGVLGKGAAQFTDAANEFLSITHAAQTGLSFGDEDFTYLSWVYLDSKTDVSGIMGKDGAGDRGHSLDYLTATDRFRFLVGDSAVAVSIEQADVLGSPSIDTWYFIIGWHDDTANTINIQINNGTADSSTPAITPATNISDFNIGHNPVGAANHMDGRLDSAAVYSRVLTSDEKTWLYNSGGGRKYIELGEAGDGSDLLTSLVSWWELDELSGTRIDAHGSNNLTDNATVTNEIGIREGGELTDGVAVTKREDQSGNGNDVTQITAAKIASYQVAEVNSKDTVEYDGVDDGHTSSTPLTGSAGAFYALVQLTAEPNATQIIVASSDEGTGDHY